MLIFGYGSLVNVEHLQSYLERSLVPGKDFVFCRLQNYCRCWTAAMDNSVNMPGYKYYVEKYSGDRPEGFVTFLNIRPCRGTFITGIAFEVSEQELEHLDRRERNYQKLDVTAMIDGPISKSVCAYIGLAEAEQRYQQGLKTETAMIAQDYYELVYQAYQSLGEKALTDYINTTDPPQIPIVDLEKRQVAHVGL